MYCPSCHARVPSGAFCISCGYALGGTFVPKKKARKRANGQGCVQRVTRLKKQWHAKITKDGKCIDLGYYYTQAEALAALSPQNVERITSVYGVTLGEAWQQVMQSKSFVSLSALQQSTLRSAYSRYLSPLAERKLRDLRPRDYQPIIDAMSDEGLSVSLQKKVLQVISKICSWGRQNDILLQNYADLIYTDDAPAKERHIFTDAQISTLFAHQGERAVDIILVLIGTGMRPVDLSNIIKDNRINPKDHYLQLAGSKTAAGRNRHLYLNSAIWPIFSRYYLAAEPGAYLFPALHDKNTKLVLKNFRLREFYPALDALGIMPNPYDQSGMRIDDAPPYFTPYCCRHTFFSLANRAGVKKEILQKTGGHALGSNITEMVYIHENAAEFSTELDKLGTELLTLSHA